MKTNKLLYILIILLFPAISCTEEASTVSSDKNEIINDHSNHSQVTITGKSTNGYTDNETRASRTEQIQIGDYIIFYSNGGVKADGEILKYDNGVWTGLNDNKWYIDDGPANIVAYYPAIQEAADLYSENGELKDIVCCKDTINSGNTINLYFNHIFSKLVINIDKDINDTVKNVHVNIPRKVNHIDLYTSEYTTSEVTNGLVREKSENCRYEFLIPSNCDMRLSLIIECNNTTLDEITIKNNIFKSGFEYICNIRKSSENGIYTEEDFIAFTHLINGETEYNGKKIEDFYIEIDGKRVFNLYKNLSFTDEEADKIVLIKEFNDIFDGNNHTISNLKAHKNYRANFCLIDNNYGEIKNLTIDKCTFDYPEFNYATAGCLFVNYNYGIIDNFHLTNGFINMKTENEDSKKFGGLSYLNKGTIVNSSISNLTLGSNNAALGIFIFQNAGNILNCRINNNINKNTTGKISSTICVYNSMRLYNIFVTEYKQDYYGICYENDLGHYYNCILPEEYNGKAIYSDHKSETALKKAVYYSETPEEYSRIIDELNQWIEDNKSKYPTITFRKWKTDPAEKVVFE